MLAALAAPAAPLVDADGFALEGTTTMLAAGRPGSVWMLRTVPLYDDMCVSTDGHGAFGGIAAGAGSGSGAAACVGSASCCRSSGSVGITTEAGGSVGASGRMPADAEVGTAGITPSGITAAASSCTVAD